ncbi:c-type cytochrome domain-containing protein [Jiulongibacter sediminis]|uniref:Cytochrome C Planctomycete-type domain-containing protein n=1 Tax=Jiulongibacter sediminis TaxID=1605367 RepID=A0A0P7C5S1_9BACT|nr:c-type cytochrome domain-containing protein [Jiulongibacter sediminis]KPM48674.1 hypothetical protein AFM12_08740 [Jiulongibacter sediminis]TBX25210.1 hypothetical protein TK44_08745 [Jiulongibacter sediminis]
MKEFIAQFHPLLVHLPIGFLLIGLVFFLLHKKGVEGISDKTIRWILLFSFLASLFSSISGYLLADGGGYDSELVNKHRNGGISLILLTGLLYILNLKEQKGLIINILWAVSSISLFLTGHWGGSLTHGEDFLSFGSTEYTKPEITDPQQALVYQEIIEPIFAEKCWSCHSSKKQKGDLRLDSPEAILQGGENGEILTAHQPKQSELYKRLLLEKEDDDRMPPDGKPQLTKDEIQLIEWWIATGLSFDQKAGDLEQSPAVQLALKSLVKAEATPAPIPPVEQKPVEESLIQSLNVNGVSLQKVADESPFLSLSIISGQPDQSVWKSFEPLSKNIIWLRINNQELTAEKLKAISGFEYLTTLDLSQNTFENSSRPDFSQFTYLQKLNLANSNISFEALQTLAELENLDKLFLFGTSLSKEQKEKFKTMLPKTTIEFGNYEVPTLEGDTTEFTMEMLTSAKEL